MFRRPRESACGALLPPSAPLYHQHVLGLFGSIIAFSAYLSGGPEISDLLGKYRSPDGVYHVYFYRRSASGTAATGRVGLSR